MERLHRAHVASPIGLVEACGTADGVVSVGFVEDARDSSRGDARPVDACVAQLAEYFEGRRRDFTVPLQPRGTAFQRRVWGALTSIPFGSTVTYTDIAAMLGLGKSVRAVGHANGRNRIAIVVPCHRVIGRDGTLKGYADGLWRKEWLLRHEKNLT